MRVEQLGEGEPEIAIVGSIHGDEPCGAEAIERVLADPPAVGRPVKFIIANERALSRGVRYTESDLNREFPGDPDADTYEAQLAHELLEQIGGCTVLSMHSTQSYDRPFAIVDETGPLSRTICPQISIDALVETGGFVGNTLVGYVNAIEVECGIQGTATAVENAEKLVSEFLRATGAVTDGGGKPATPGTIPVYMLRHQITKDPESTYSVHVENFRHVETGEPFATIDGKERRAEESFYPVLMSSHGYERQLGYAAELRGVI
ncbi:M14 family metallopeptidase [Halocatena halophila]|uniref:succinylglutamate desuccinylase/aspartoacylase domain-containing protein n=1 Tax=Halocatena halophila TaxID=2814576 RepID=UPI002ED19190